MSRFVYDTIWYNSTCVKYVWTCMTQSYSLDRFDKWAVKNFLKLNVLKSKNYCNRVMDYRLQHIGKWQIFQHKTEARRSSIVTNICYFCYFLCFKINFVFRLQPLTILVLSGFPAFWSTIRQHLFLTVDRDMCSPLQQPSVAASLARTQNWPFSSRPQVLDVRNKYCLKVLQKSCEF